MEGLVVFVATVVAVRFLHWWQARQDEWAGVREWERCREELDV